MAGFLEVTAPPSDTLVFRQSQERVEI